MSGNKHEYGESFLYADDLVGNGQWISVELEIGDFIPANSIKAANGKIVDRECVQLKSASNTKIFALCKTNRRLLQLACGSANPEKWKGQRVRVAPHVLKECFGEPNVPCVRVQLSKDIPMPQSCRSQMGRSLVGQRLTAPADGAKEHAQG